MSLRSTSTSSVVNLLRTWVNINAPPTKRIRIGRCTPRFCNSWPSSARYISISCACMAISFPNNHDDTRSLRTQRPRSNILCAWSQQLLALILLNRMRNPTHSPSQGKKRQRTLRRKVKGLSQHHQREIHIRLFAGHLQNHLCNRLRQLHCGRVGKGLGDEPEQQRGTYITIRIEAVSEARDILSPAQVFGNHPASRVRRAHLAQQLLDQQRIPSMLETLQRRQASRYYQVELRFGRGHHSCGKC